MISTIRRDLIGIATLRNAIVHSLQNDLTRDITVQDGEDVDASANNRLRIPQYPKHRINPLDGISQEEKEMFKLLIKEGEVLDSTSPKLGK